MQSENKLLKLFFEVHGCVGGSCSLKIEYDDEQDPVAVAVMKDGNLCWRATREKLLFDYVTRDFQG